MAAVAAAAHGDTIEIRSNQLFQGTLTWKNRFLTIKAGAGYQPTIRGDSFFAGIDDISGTPGTGGIFEGLRVEGGEFRGSVRIVPSGSNHSNLTFLDNQFVNSVDFVPFSSSTLQVVMERNVLSEGMSFAGTGSAPKAELMFRSNIVEQGLNLGSTGSVQTKAVIDRNVFHNLIIVGGTGSSKLDALVTNNVIAIFDPAARRPDTAGINALGISSSVVNARFLNNTVVGFDYGIRVENNQLVTFENMLLYNSDDIANFGNGNFTIANSLISDGTTFGANGNFAGVPNLGPDFRLLPGSIGIDAGNNNALQLPTVDLVGSPRVLDGNRDGISRVDVGAYELVVPEPEFAVLALSIVALFPVRLQRLFARSGKY